MKLATDPCICARRTSGINAIASYSWNQRRFTRLTGTEGPYQFWQVQVPQLDPNLCSGRYPVWRNGYLISAIVRGVIG